jgi:hypothetical protein
LIPSSFAIGIRSGLYIFFINNGSNKDISLYD